MNNSNYSHVFPVGDRGDNIRIKTGQQSPLYLSKWAFAVPQGGLPPPCEYLLDVDLAKSLLEEYKKTLAINILSEKRIEMEELRGEPFQLRYPLHSKKGFHSEQLQQPAAPRLDRVFRGQALLNTSIISRSSVTSSYLFKY